MRQFWVFAAAAAVLTGCGGGGASVTSGSAPTTASTASAAPTATPAGSPVPASEADAIQSLVTEVEVIHNFSSQCSTYFTSAFIDEAFGSLSGCRTAGFPKPADYATSATVDSITGDGNTATGVVTDHGGLEDGASGPWQFVRSAGTWKVADQSATYLRAEISAELGPKYDSEGSNDPFASAGYRNCFASALQAKDDATFKSWARGVSVPKYAQRVVPLLAGCSSSGPNGENPFRALFEKGLRLGAGTKVPSSVIDCTIADLRTAVSDLDIIEAGLAGKGSTQATNLEAAAVSAARKCASSAGAATPKVSAPEVRMGIRRAGSATPDTGASAEPTAGASEASVSASPATDAPTPAS